MTKNKKLIIPLLILVFLLIGFTREFIFNHTNTVLYNKLHPEFTYPVPALISYLNHFEYKTVYALKWVFTALFCLLFFLLQRWTLKTVFPEKKYARWLLYFYLILLLLSVLAFGSGYIIGNTGGGYRFSRMFMGILQSPVPLMFLIPVGILKNKFDKAQQ